MPVDMVEDFFCSAPAKVLDSEVLYFMQKRVLMGETTLSLRFLRQNSFQREEPPLFAASCHKKLGDDSQNFFFGDTGRPLSTKNILCTL